MIAARTTLLAACALLLSGCMGIFELQHTGDVVELNYEGADIRCELLAISDSMMYLIPTADNDPALRLSAGMIYEAPPFIFRSGEVQGYMNREWVLPVMLLQVLPTVMVVIEAAVYDSRHGSISAFWPIFGALSLTNVIMLYASSSDPPEFTRTLTPEEMQLLRKYARYPQGLRPDQLDLLLSVRRQTAPLPLPVYTPGVEYRMTR